MSSEELLRRYWADGGATAAENASGAPAAPSLQTVVLTCMDARIDVLDLFDSGLGDVHVLRNAGGVVTEDVARSITISQRKLGTRDVLIVQHTQCGLATFTDDAFSAELEAEVGVWPPWRPHAFTDPVVSVRRGMERLRRDPFLLPSTVVRGFVLDIERFALHEVLVEERALPDV